ncbi:MAG: hypothetical protein U0X91_30435 [Spirosomataceae bacterium]
MTHSPFKFLEAYNDRDKHLFFGREQEIETLFNLTFRSRFILVYGPSGTGKTSLIRSGLSKKLSDTDWFSLYIRRKQDINASLREELAKWDKRKETRPISEQIRYISLLYLRPVYLLFDQLEELFISGDDQEQYEFLTTLIDLYQTDVPCKIVLSMREEYLAQLYSFEESLPTLFDYRLRVEQMGDERTREVIIQTFAALPQVKLEQPATDAEVIVENLKEPGKLIQLPYLQVYLDRLWYKAAEHPSVKKDGNITINESVINEVGRIDEVLEEYVEEQIAKVQEELPELANRPNYVHKLLDNFVTSGGTRKNVTLNDFPNDADKPLRVKVLKELENRRILLEDNGSYEFFHDSLAGVIFRKRSADQKRLYNLIRRLRQAYSDYESNAGNPDFFLNKLSSQEFRVSESGVREELNETDFQKISSFVESGEQFRESERLSKEMEKRKRKRVLLNLSVLLAVVIGLGSLAILQWQKSLVSNLVSLSSNLILKSNPEDALTLAWQAYRLLPEPMTERALLNAFNEYDSPEEWTEIVTKDLPKGEVQQVRVAADERSLFVLKGGKVYVWNTAGEALSTLSVPTGVKTAELSPDSKYILTVSNDSIAQLWSNRGKPVSFTKTQTIHAFFLPSFNPNLLIVSATDPAEALIWRQGDSASVKLMHGAPITKIAFSDNGERIFTLSGNGLMKAWDREGKVLSSALFQGLPVKLICNKNNDHFAVVLPSNTVLLKGINPRDSTIKLKTNAQKILDIAFTGDGASLRTVNAEMAEDKDTIFTVSQWSLNGTLMARNQFRFPNPSCRFSPNAQWLINESPRATSKPGVLWSVEGKTNKPLFKDDGRWVFSPNSKMIAAVEESTHQLRIWEQRGRLRSTLTGHTDAVYKAVFSVDSLYLFTASADFTYRVRDFRNPQLSAPTPYPGIVRDIAPPRFGKFLVCYDQTALLYTPDGHSHALEHRGDIWSGELSPDPNSGYVLTASDDATAVLWNDKGDRIRTFQHRKGVNRATFSPDGQSILTACYDSLARLWSIKNTDPPVLMLHLGSVSYAAFSPNLKNPLIITTSADSTARLWDEDGHQLLLLQHSDFVSSAAISSDRQTLLTATNGGIAQLWDRDGEVKGVFEAKSPIYHASFSPNDQFVVLACENGEVQLWPTLSRIERWANQDTLNSNNHILHPHHLEHLKKEYQIADTVGEDFLSFLDSLWQKSSQQLNDWYHQLKRALNV